MLLYCAGEEESPYSEAARALLANADGIMPEMILKLDVSSVNTIVNDVLESSKTVQWDDIAGVHHCFCFSCFICIIAMLTSIN